MTLRSSSNSRTNAKRTRPALEALEERKLLSRQSAAAAAASDSSGVLSSDNRTFSYTTPTGGHAVIRVIGLGNLLGTQLTPSGALELVYGDTNAYSKIVGTVRGGGGHAPLESILNARLIDAGASNSLSGQGGDVAAAFLLSPFDLIDGGRINLTSGVNSLNLDSIGADTQINLRTLPPPPSTENVLPTSQLLVGTSVNSSTSAATTGTGNTGTNTGTGNTSSSGSATITIFRAFATTTSTTSSQNTTLQALQSTSVTNPYNVTTTYVSNGNGSQTLTGISGEFTFAGNIVEPLATGDSINTVPPAPPGIILKVNRVQGGKLSAPINPLTDSKIYGYDPSTGEVIRFDLNLVTRTAVVDTTVAPIVVPGHPAVAGLDLAWNGSQRVVLVSSGTTVYAYNATTEAPVGSFTDVGSFMGSLPINSVAATDTLTVLGSYQTNQLYAINLTASLASGVAQPATGTPPAYTPQAQFTLLGGLTSSPGTNIVFAAVAAHLDSTQPNQTQLGIQAVGTALVVPIKGQGSVLTNALFSVANTPIKTNSAFVNVPAAQPATSPPGPALGSIDQSLALVLSASGGTNTIDTENGLYTFKYPNALGGLSESFRPDLVGTALIDIQGTVQSIRGSTATGMVLNDTGNLNLVKFNSVSYSSIVGQPIGHLEIGRRSHVLAISPRRAVAGRNGVTIFQGLQRIGPLTQPND